MVCASATYADVYLAEGVNADNLAESIRFYDGGKGRDWDDFERAAYDIYTDNGNDLSVFGDLSSSISVPEYQSRLDCSALYSDNGHCWAYTSSNMLQYWQTYYGVFAKKAGDTTKEAPVHGYNYDTKYMTELGGTQSLQLNKLFYDSFDGKTGGSTNKAFGWYLQGENYWGGQNDNTSAPGYFSQYFAHYNDTHTTINGQNLSSLSAMSDSIKQAFGYTQQNGEWEQTTKGQIMHLELKAGSSSHAITCYGFETDAEGNIKALYIVNSDDAKYELIKVYTKFEVYGEYDYRLTLHYDEECSGYNTYNAWTVTGWSNLNTPEVLKQMLAEYENGKQTWMGNLESWTNTAAMEADVNVLPTDETGWMTYAGTGTEHAGYYNTYYTAGSGVVFNDAATSGTVNVGDNIEVSSMEVNNNSLAYSFNGGESQKTITVADFTKTGSGSLSFSNIKLVADDVTLSGNVTFDELHVKGELQADAQTITVNSLRLDGNAKIGTLTDGAELTISGGKVTIANSSSWTNIDSLAMSDQARLEIGASLKVAGNITSCDATGTLAEGEKSGIKTKWALEVGTEGDASTGNVNLVGDITAGAYIKILGDATVSGSVTTDKGDITIGGKANIGGNLSTAQGGNIYLNKGGTVGGTLSAATITVKDNASLGTIGSISGENETGTVALVVSGGTTEVKSTNWTNLKSLALSEQARLNVAASLNVAENITTSSAATATLAEGTRAGIDTKYALKVGGKVTLSGDIVAHSYINIGGDANLTGNLHAYANEYNGNDSKVIIGGNATVGGELSSVQNTDIKGNASIAGKVNVGTQMNVGGALSLGEGGTVGGTLSAGSVELAAGKTLEAKGGLTVNGALTGGEGSTKALATTEGSMTLGGSVKNIDLKAQSITMAAADGSELTLDSVNITLTGGELSLTNTRVQGDCSFTTTSASPLTMKVDGVIFVLDASNSAVRGQEAQIMTLGIATESSNPIYIDSTMLEGLNVEGNMTLDLSHWADEINSGAYDSLVMTFTEDTDFSQTKEVTVELGNGVTGKLEADSDSPNSFVLALPKAEQAIPEPTTASLSLLALAALAARRRRK